MTGRKKYGFELVIAVLLAVPLYGQGFSVMYKFGRQTNDPTLPNGNVVQGRDGALYATSYSGGAQDAGTVFKITPWGAMRVLYSFCSQTNCLDGANPTGGLMLRPDGHFLGTAETGGRYGYGTIFDITQTGDLHVLYNFSGGRDGAYPAAPPVLGPDGSYYGTTWEGGAASGCGAIYKIRNSGLVYGGFKLVHDFMNGDGCNPTAALALGADGSLYGTTNYGGSAGYGVIFEVTLSGVLTVLHEFQGVGDGFNPDGALIQGTDGNFYGTTRGIGAPYGGTVFRISPGGQFGVLHDFSNATDGAWLIGSIVEGSDGNFYGAAEQGGMLNCSAGNGCGTVFRLTPTGSFTVLYDFNNSDGYWADTTPVQHTNGRLYGDTYWGGLEIGSCVISGCGVVYSLDLGLRPFVALVPYRSAAGSSVEILGQGFTPASTVTFNGMPATATVVTGNYLRAIVPDGAESGFVAVTTSDGTLTSNQPFEIAP